MEVPAGAYADNCGRTSHAGLERSLLDRAQQFTRYAHIDSRFFGGKFKLRRLQDGKIIASKVAAGDKLLDRDAVTPCLRHFSRFPSSQLNPPTVSVMQLE